MGDHVQASILPHALCAPRGAREDAGRGTGISGDPLRGTRFPICPAASTRRRSRWGGAHPCPRLADRKNLPARGPVGHASKTEAAKQAWVLVVPKRRPQLYAPPRLERQDGSPKRCGRPAPVPRGRTSAWTLPLTRRTGRSRRRGSAFRAGLSAGRGPCGRGPRRPAAATGIPCASRPPLSARDGPVRAV